MTLRELVWWLIGSAALCGIGIVLAALFIVMVVVDLWPARRVPVEGYQPQGSGEPMGPPPNQGSGGFK